MIFRFSMLSGSESRLPLNASFTIAVFRFCICTMRPSMVPETYTIMYISIPLPSCRWQKQTHDEMSDMKRLLLPYPMDAVDSCSDNHSSVFYNCSWESACVP